MSEYQYKRYKNCLTDVILKAKELYFQSTFEKHQKDMRATWRIISGIVYGGGPLKNITNINVDGVDIRDKSVIATKFNDHFNSVGLHFDSGIPPRIGEPIDSIDNLSQSMFLYPVTDLEVVNVVRRLKNTSYGLHNIPTRIFKLIVNHLSQPISNLISKSFSSSVFPDSLKKCSYHSNPQVWICYRYECLPTYLYSSITWQSL